MIEQFNEWFNEQENFSCRSERFYDDLLFIKTNPILTTTKAAEHMKKWLMAAFCAGVQANKNE